jgi:protein-S-isoprenylcysteine O-methyltransferase Ste14
LSGKRRVAHRYTPRARAGQREEAPLGASRKPTWRRFVAYLFGAALLALADPAASPIAPWNLAAGAALCLFGAFWRVWGCGHLRKNQAVISSGPYAHVRNPLYLGTLLNLFGFGLAAGHPVILYGLLPAGLLVFALYYIPKKERVESDRLRKRFGAEFDEYHAAVPGYLPRVTRWKGAKTDRMSWALVVENSELETQALIFGGLAVMTCRFFGVIPPYLGLGG